MSLDRRTLLITSLAAGVASAAKGQTPPPRTSDSRWLAEPDPTETLDLWPGAPPGSSGRLPVEIVRERSTDRAYNDRFIAGVARPRMAVFRPAKPNGAAVLITPGGGY